MSLNEITLAVCSLFSQLGCGDHYEGGGRRQELPIAEPTDMEVPNIAPGDSGGAPASGPSGGEAGAAGSEAG